MLKIEKLKTDQNTDDDLELKIKLLEDEVSDKQRELDINKKIMNEALEQLSHFQAHNSFLRSHIEAIEDKMKNIIKESPPDIFKLVQNHLEAMSISVKAVQVTENIFKIDNESLHIFVNKNELMVQQGGHTTTFVE